MPRTSNKKEEILQFLNRFMEENGYAPTVREIGKAVGLKSTATVHYHLEALQRENRITMPEMKKRAITVAGSKPGQIPILGTVTAGQPILAFENITVTLDEAYRVSGTDTYETDKYFYDGTTQTLYNKAKTELIFMPIAIEGEITIPATVEKLTYTAVNGCSKIMIGI